MDAESFWVISETFSNPKIARKLKHVICISISLGLFIRSTSNQNRFNIKFIYTHTFYCLHPKFLPVSQIIPLVPGMQVQLYDELVPWHMPKFRQGIDKHAV